MTATQFDETSGCFENPLSPTSSTSQGTTAAATTPTPKYFAAHRYEYEISPEQLTKSTSPDSNPSSPSPDSASSSIQITTSSSYEQQHIITETSVPMTKTIYLIRHAESDENRRKECLKTSVKGLSKLKLPKREDVVASMELMNVGAQLDSNVSPRGQAQIDQLGQRISKDDFVRKMGIELVAHSPLQRARQTSYGMLQCVAPASSQTNTDNNGANNNSNQDSDTKTDAETDPTIEGCIHPSVKRVVELDILSERTPIEWLPIQHDAFTKRIAEFEMWLAEQPEDVIAVVGHSLYFKNMLGLESKFHNVDVWSLQFDFTLENSVQRVRRDVHVANESETKKKIQKHFENLGSIIQKSNIQIRRRRNNGINSTNNDCYDQNDVGDKSQDGSLADGSSFDLDNRDELDTSSPQSNNLSAQTEIDGVSLEKLQLPRGWRELKHHYRYDPTYAED